MKKSTINVLSIIPVATSPGRMQISHRKMWYLLIANSSQIYWLSGDIIQNSTLLKCHKSCCFSRYVQQASKWGPKCELSEMLRSLQPLIMQIKIKWRYVPTCFVHLETLICMPPCLIPTNYSSPKRWKAGICHHPPSYMVRNSETQRLVIPK